MQKSVAIFILSLSLIACTKKQYLTFDSELQLNDKQEFVYQNDLFKLTYSFDASNNLLISIKNKTSDFLTIDWDKSAIVYEGNSIPFDKGEIKLSGSAIENFSGAYSTEATGSVDLGNLKEHLPPNATTSKSVTFLPFYYKKIANTTPDQKIPLGEGATAKRYYFEPTDSLNYFESYLFIHDEMKNDKSYLNHHFWVSSLLECLDCSPERMSNQIVFRKATAATNVIAGVVLVPLIAVAAANEVDE